MSTVGQSWTLVIFCYNEAGTVAHVITEALLAGQHLAAKATFEVLVVDDGSIDGSATIIDQLATQHPQIAVVRHPTNRGIGPALISGYRYARYENVCAIPADGQFNIQELYPFSTFGADEIISFYRPEKTGYERYRKILTWVNLTLNYLLLGLKMKDVNWVKAYKKKQLGSLPLYIESSLLESEVCAKLKHMGIKIREYPSTYLPRQAGTPKGGSLKTLFAAAKEIIKLVWVVNKFRLRKPRQLVAPVRD